jgi:nicotinate-nucleotide adenylyltransferase
MSDADKGRFIALLGGSFNPPHVGHLLAAHFVWATQPIDELWLVPSFRHPFGKPMVAFEHRVRMCQLLAAATSGWMKVSEVEKAIGGEGRTVETLSHLKREQPQERFLLVIGSDILPQLPQWKDWDRVRQLAQVLVLHRAGYPAQEAWGPPLATASSTEVRELLAKGLRPSELVPRDVLDYAQAHGLYTPAG